MKSIFKISMICALLLSLCGTVEAARKYSPGVAERKAITGDFDVEESEQILADIPEEWKKEHRSIVNQMRNRTRGRGATTRGMKEELEFEDVERKSSENDYKQPEPTPAELEKSPKNQTRLVKNILGSLNQFMEKLYKVEGTDGWKVPQLGRFMQDYSETRFYVDKDRYSSEYSSLIDNYNSFVTAVEEFEKGKRFQIDVAKKGEMLLEDLSKLKDVADTETKNACEGINLQLTKWNKGRLENSSNDFNQKLNESIVAFGGEVAIEGKKTNAELLRQMDNTLNTLINARYDKKVGTVSYHWEPKNIKLGIQKFILKADKYQDENANSIEMFNSMVKAIYADDKNAKESVKEAIQYSIQFVKNIASLKTNNKSSISQIKLNLNSWNEMRIGYLYESWKTRYPNEDLKKALKLLS